MAAAAGAPTPTCTQAGGATPHGPAQVRVPPSPLDNTDVPAQLKDSRSGTEQAGPVLHTFLFYYGKGENATFSTTATGKIYPKNNSIQNRSVSELKKKQKTKNKDNGFFSKYQSVLIAVGREGTRDSHFLYKPYRIT